MDRGAFLGTDPTDEPITSGLPVSWQNSQTEKRGSPARLEIRGEKAAHLF
jgi:hypothetical protein